MSHPPGHAQICDYSVPLHAFVKTLSDCRTITLWYIPSPHPTLKAEEKVPFPLGISLKVHPKGQVAFPVSGRSAPSLSDGQRIVVHDWNCQSAMKLTPTKKKL